MSVALKKLRIAEEEVEALKAQLTAVTRERDELKGQHSLLQSCARLLETENDRLKAELATLRDGWIPATYEVCPDCEGDGHFGLDGQNEFCKCKKCAGKGYLGTPAHIAPPTDGRAE